jgi:hypothetical protein
VPIKILFVYIVILASFSVGVGLRAQEKTTSSVSQGFSTDSQVKLSTLSERFEIGEQLIVTVRVGTFNYGEVFAVVSEDGLYTSVEELIAVLDFPINRFSDEAFLLKGWFIAENKTFEMRLFDTPSAEGVGEVIIEGQRELIRANQYMEIAGERLVNFDVVGAWFGLSLSFDQERLSVNAIASTPLPAQSKLKREKQNVSDRGHLIPKHPNFDFGYFARSHQMFDASVSSVYRNDKINSFYSVVGIQDVAGLSTRFFARGTDDDLLQSANINFQRQSLEGNLLGPLNATTIEFGDIRPTRVAGVTGGESIGININNQKLGQAYDFEFTNITGVIQEGWDVELYQNGVLTRKELNTSGGQYEFLDVPLFGQLNIFDIIKYGPQGQVEKERVERNLDNQTFSQVPRYNVSLTRSNSALLTDNNANSEEQDWFLSGAYSYTFLNWLSTNFSHNINVSDSTGLYSVGATARLSPRLLSSVSYKYVDKDQQALSLSFQSRLYDQFVNLNYSRNFKANNAYNDALGFKMAGNIFQGDLGRLSYSNDYLANKSSTGDYTQRIGNTLTWSSRFGFLSHSYSQISERNGDIRDVFKTGGITFGGARGKFNTRFNANYEFSEEDDELVWRGAEASFNYEFYNDLSTQFKASRAFESKVNNYQFSLQWMQPSYALFGSVSHNSNNDTTVSLNARFSMSETPFGKGYITSGRALTNNALVAVRLFEDVNQNFVFDEGDRPIPEVKIKAEQLARTAVSDNEGIAILEGIASFKQTDLNVDLSSLDDPYLMQSTINTSLTPRSGLLTLINYPFVQGIEFEGELSGKSTKEDKPIALKNAVIEIYRSNGELAKTVKTEFDGYFYSGVMLPDTYKIRVAEDYQLRNDIKVDQDIIIKANKAGSFVPDVQIVAQLSDTEQSYQPFLSVFSTEGTAKAYINMFRFRYRSYALADKLRLHHSILENKYYVGFDAFKDQDLAEEFCERNKPLIPSCKVRKDKFQIVAQATIN